MRRRVPEMLAHDPRAARLAARFGIDQNSALPALIGVAAPARRVLWAASWWMPPGQAPTASAEDVLDALALVAAALRKLDDHDRALMAEAAADLMSDQVMSAVGSAQHEVVVARRELEATETLLVRAAVTGDVDRPQATGRRPVRWEEVLAATGQPHEVLAARYPYLAADPRIVSPPVTG